MVPSSHLSGGAAAVLPRGELHGSVEKHLKTRLAIPISTEALPVPPVLKKNGVLLSSKDMLHCRHNSWSSALGLIATAPGAPRHILTCHRTCKHRRQESRRFLSQLAQRKLTAQQSVGFVLQSVGEGCSNSTRVKYM